MIKRKIKDKIIHREFLYALYHLTKMHPEQIIRPKTTNCWGESSIPFTVVKRPPDFKEQVIQEYGHPRLLYRIAQKFL